MSKPPYGKLRCAHEQVAVCLQVRRHASDGLLQPHWFRQVVADGGEAGPHLNSRRVAAGLFGGVLHGRHAPGRGLVGEERVQHDLVVGATSEARPDSWFVPRHPDMPDRATATATTARWRIDLIRSAHEPAMDRDAASVVVAGVLVRDRDHVRGHAQSGRETHSNFE